MSAVYFRIREAQDDKSAQNKITTKRLSSLDFMTDHSSKL